MAPPIYESAEKTAIAKMRQSCPYPGRVKSPELGVSHLAAGHQKLAVSSASHMASDGNVVGLVSQDQPRLLIGHENFESIGVGGSAANNAVLPQGEDVPELRDRLCIWVWAQRTRFGCGDIIHHNLVNFDH